MSNSKWDRLAFILGMKKNKFPQVSGKLFMLSEEGDVYACAMGQGLLDSGIITEEQVRSQLKPEPLGAADFQVRELDGKVRTIRGRYKYELESIYSTKAQEELGSEFWEAVVTKNDREFKPLPEIGAEIRTQFDLF